MNADENFLALAAGGDPDALATLFREHEPRLRRMIELKLDRRIRARLSVSDVVQESYIEYAESFPRYKRQGDIPFYLWLRTVAIRKLSELQRRHLGTAARQVSREVRLQCNAEPNTSSFSLAEFFVASITSPSQAAMRMELQVRIQCVLNDMDAADREVLSLRHFEQLTNNEVAQVLELSAAAASLRYFRALKRLRPLLNEIIPREDRGSHE